MLPLPTERLGRVGRFPHPQDALPATQIHTILPAAQGRGMRASKWSVSIVLGLSSMPVGADTAQAQTALLRICNEADVVAYAAVSARPAPGDPRFLISGWYRIETGRCGNIKYVAAGWIYLYAESLGNPMVWRGQDKRFCVANPGPFERFVSGDYTCFLELLKGFTAYFIQPGVFTWTLH
jgi:uncharacterized membrane protein